MLCAVIMAGGKGERFWPISTEEIPKQFLNLLGQESMIQLTFKRLKGVIDIDKIFIVTARRYKELILEHIPEIDEKNIILEPEAKNTAPCIALSAFLIKERFENPNILVLPSDHLILNEEKFIEAIKKGDELINIDKKGIVTIGIEPTRPDTGYGYIKRGEQLSENITRCAGFKEKPNLEKANEYLESKEYFWNSGIFIWNCKTILAETKKYIPEIYNILSDIEIINGVFNENDLESKYKLVKSISVDYGIMENTKNIYIVKGEFTWDDLGSWNSLSRYKSKDRDNNIIDGSVIAIESKGNIIQTKKKTYVMGIKELLIIETDNEIMILNRRDVSKIKELKNYG